MLVESCCQSVGMRALMENSVSLELRFMCTHLLHVLHDDAHCVSDDDLGESVCV